MDNLLDFRKLISALALRSGNIINQTEIAREIGISQPTVHRYIKLMEILNIIRKVPANFSNRLKRIIKSLKIFFIDPAFCAYLS
uniref:DUF4143 domain-containing protein n=1 Tax=Dictyoglomus thermophilum TaxID=14 RepID=A0A7C3RML9_DICTH